MRHRCGLDASTRGDGFFPISFENLVMPGVRLLDSMR